METLIFVLGTLSGLVLLALGYAVVGVIKINKLTKSLQQQIEGIHRDGFRDIWQTIDQRSSEVDRRFHELFMEMDKRWNELHRELDNRFRDVNSEIIETRRYTDSRLDKMIDSLTNKDSKNKKTVETV
jgi:hypothetical protein